MSTRIRIADALTAASRNAARGLAIAAIGALGVAAFTATADAKQTVWVKQSLKDHVNRLGSTGSNSGDWSAPAQAHNGYGQRPHYAQPDVFFRCSAAALSRRGRELAGTRAIADRRSEGVACQAALNSCVARLERKRAFEGRGFRYAHCEITRSRQIAAAPGAYGGLWSNVEYRY